MQLEFWFDFASTYSYPAAMRIEQVASRCGVTLTWRPFLLGPIFKAQGWTDSPFNIHPVKGRYMWRDVERVCADHNLPFRRASVFPRNGLLAARVACQFSGAAWVPTFVRGVYQANFERDEDISTAAVVTSCLQQAGQHAAPILAAAALPEAKDALKRQTEQAVQLGIFGAPSFVVGDELFWGQDRLEKAMAWCAARAGRPAADILR